MRDVVDRVAPPGSRTRAALRVGAATARDAATYASATRWRWQRARTPDGSGADYGAWLASHRLSASDLKRQHDRVAAAPIDANVECVIVADGRGAEQATLRSLEAQTFAGWTPHVLRPGSGLGDGDPRSFVVFLAAGDVLEPDLAFQIAARGWDDPSVELVYWDDDVIDDAGTAGDPRFRPGWSPEALLSADVLGRAFAVRRRRLGRLGGVAATVDPERLWELVLRLDLDERQVTRAPRVLQHLRGPRERPAPLAAARLVERHLRAQGREASVRAPEGSALRIRWRLATPPTVTIVIPTRQRETLLNRCLESLVATRYAGFDVVVVDSGRRDGSTDAFYDGWSRRLVLEAASWDGPFNYSAANNMGARVADGEVLVFLNDDTVITDPAWLEELVGWAIQPEIGLVGSQLLDGEGLIQHGGVVVGMDGFAGHLFAGVAPRSETMLGSTDWYRNCLSITAACVAVTRELFEQIGGFDERFVLCGSDVVLGLDARARGRRNVCSPFAGVRHLEGRTRGAEVPPGDFFSSYWRYQRWLRGGDPYYSPNLSLESGVPRLREPSEPAALERVGVTLGRRLGVFRQSSSEDETGFLVRACRADRFLAQRVSGDNRGAERAVTSINWFLPDIDSPFYGGINTALRLADLLARRDGVRNRFVLLSDPNERYVRSALEAAFPALGDAEVAFSNGRVGPNLQEIPAADASIATQWHTAYMAANFAHTRRRFYLIQDFEPIFYPGGSNYALAEQTYRLGLEGICNTAHMLALYQERYAGHGMSFMPAVDRSIFHANGRPPRREHEAVTIFIYARPGVWRNCWELADLALTQLKRRLGDDVRIITAGSWARPDDLGRGIEHLGLLDYRETGDLYRRADLGVVLTVSEHPSYLPLELLACGTPVVAFDNPAGDWILRHERNCLRCPQTADGLIEALERLATDPALRARLGAQGARDMEAEHGDWDRALAGVYDFLCHPDRVDRHDRDDAVR